MVKIIIRVDVLRVGNVNNVLVVHDKVRFKTFRRTRPPPNPSPWVQIRSGGEGFRGGQVQRGSSGWEGSVAPQKVLKLGSAIIFRMVSEYCSACVSHVGLSAK